VEYKLQLLSPTPARFARLVTQMKWRLLEGGGEALYEIGVADSGQLVGLQRCDLERSLETLEEMAGEIGASVIVVKEIEVPKSLPMPALSWNAINKSGGKVDGAMRMPKHKLLLPMSASPSLSTGEEEYTETEPSSPDDDHGMPFGDMSYVSSPSLSPEKRFKSVSHSERRMLVDPSRPSVQSSPQVVPVDEEDECMFTLDLEINSVYKPRPGRRRPSSTSKDTRPEELSELVSEIEALCLPPSNSSTMQPDASLPPWTKTNKSREGNKPGFDTEKKMEKRAKKWEQRNANRERNGEPRYGSEYAADAGVAENNQVTVPTVEIVAPIPMPAAVPLVVTPPTRSSDNLLSASRISPVPATEENKAGTSLVSPASEGEKHLFIVEALVVRKMSLDEAYIDFGGFSIVDFA